MAGHVCAKMAERIEMSFGLWTRVGPKKHVKGGGANWRHLANTTEPSMCVGDGGFLSNFLDHLLPAALRAAQIAGI